MNRTLENKIAVGKFGTSAYSASKAGLIALAKTVAGEVARMRILVNVVQPGWARTPLTESLPQSVRDAALARVWWEDTSNLGTSPPQSRFFVDPGAQRITDRSFASMGNSHSAVFERGVL